MAGDDWSREEVEATVGDYFAMLRDELAGLPINKSERNLRLRSLLQNRSKGSVEFKHANISAVLTLHGYPYIDGYKPRFNFQALLEQVVLEYSMSTATSSSRWSPGRCSIRRHPPIRPQSIRLAWSNCRRGHEDSANGVVSDDPAQSIRLRRARCGQP